MKALLLLSGGFDSIFLANSLIHEIESSLFVDYGQASAEQELRAASLASSELKIPLVCMKVDGLALGSMNDKPGPGARVVTGRNLVLSSLGVNLAAHRGLDSVFFGAHAGDFVEYADCREEFFTALSEISEATSGVKVMAPLVRWTKQELTEKAPPVTRHAFSCYSPVNGKACEVCNSCVARGDA